MNWAYLPRLFLFFGIVIYLGCNISLRIFRDELYFDVETDYLHWTSRLPAVSICERNSTGIFVKNLLNPGKYNCHDCIHGREIMRRFQRINEIIEEFLSPCENLLKSCKWNGQKFNCCHKFKKLVTKRGICFSVNSELVRSDRFEVSYFAKDAIVEIETSKNVKIYLHEVRDISPKRGILLKNSEKLEILYKSKETIADQSTTSLSLQTRNCVLQGEFSRVYSKSICRSRCLASYQLKYCNCTHHFVSTEFRQHCDIRGLECLDKYSKNIKMESTSFCNCYEACDEIQPTIIHAKISKNLENKGKLLMILSSPPTDRLVMKSKRNFLERLVAMACLIRWITNWSIMDLAKSFMNNVVSHKKYQ